MGYRVNGKMQMLVFCSDVMRPDTDYPTHYWSNYEENVEITLFTVPGPAKPGNTSGSTTSSALPAYNGKLYDGKYK
jgi:hypothetical protein